MKIFRNNENRWIFLSYMGKVVRAEAGAGIFDKLEPEPHKNGPAPQHCPTEGSDISGINFSQIAWLIFFCLKKIFSYMKCKLLAKKKHDERPTFLAISDCASRCLLEVTGRLEIRPHRLEAAGLRRSNSYLQLTNSELQCCGSETFHYGSGSDFSMSSGSGSNFQKVPDPVSDPTFFLKKYDFRGPKRHFRT
jgi:hypothetical protein